MGLSSSHFITRRSFCFSALMTPCASLLAGSTSQAQTGLAQSEHGVGIIFIGASWCSICKPAAAILAAMAAQSTIPVLVASQDARPIAPFPEFVDAREHALASQVVRVPHTLVFAAAQGGIVAEIPGYRSAADYAARLHRGIRAATGDAG